MEQIEIWINRARQGDADAFGRAAERLHRLVLGIAYRRLGDYHLAQDAAQMTFHEAFRNLNGLRDGRSFITWLKRIVVSQCSRIRRGSRRHEEPLADGFDDCAPGCDPSQAFELSDLLGALRTEIGALPEHQRRVVLLFYGRDYTARRVATDLGIPLTTVKKRLHDARTHLRKHIGV